jgi:pimeloyl-ACP methyl ester carboxylesterase
LLSDNEVQCSPGGQVMLLPGGRSIYDLNDDYEKQLADRRAALWKNADRQNLFEKVRQVAGIRRLANLPKPKGEELGTVTRTGYRIAKLLIKPEEGISLPALLWMPDKPKTGQVVLYVHEQGKTADAGSGGPIERLVQSGDPVLAVDLRGTGQTRPSGKGRYPAVASEFQDFYIAYLLGRSYVGMRAEDVLVCARYAAERFGGEQGSAVRLIAVGNVGIPALHAAALEPELFQSIRLSRMLVSWSNVIQSRLNEAQLAGTVHGALTHYDLPDLAAVLADKLAVDEPLDALGRMVKPAKQASTGVNRSPEDTASAKSALTEAKAATSDPRR